MRYLLLTIASGNGAYKQAVQFCRLAGSESRGNSLKNCIVSFSCPTESRASKSKNSHYVSHAHVCPLATLRPRNTAAVPSKSASWLRLVQLCATRTGAPCFIGHAACQVVSSGVPNGVADRNSTARPAFGEKRVAGAGKRVHASKI